MSQPLFTVATITYNSSKWVRETIESVLSSRYADFEYIISDDCSTDDTWKIISEYKDPRIRAWKNESNIGEYPNRQKVLERATGKYILYIDGDDILYKGTLRNYAEYLEYFPDADGVWGIPYHNRAIFPYLYRPLEMTRLVYLGSCNIPYIGFSESLFRIEAVNALGGIPLDYTTGDTCLKKKFCCRYNVLVVPMGNAYWRVRENQASDKIRSGLTGFLENYRTDKELLFSNDILLKGDELILARNNFRARTVKLLVSKTVMKFRFHLFFKMKNRTGLKIKDFCSLLTRIKEPYSYNNIPDPPLKNDYNFIPGQPGKISH